MARVDPVQSRLDFLKEAAYLIAIPSPTTSAALGTARDKLLEQHDADLEAPNKEWHALRREVCGACGNLMVPGWSCEVTHQTRSKKLGKRKTKDALKPSNRPEKDVVYTCSRCHRRTVQTLPPRPSRHAQQSTGAIDTRNIIDAFTPREKGVEATSAVIKSANASSKQRKKTRKGGLQALLDKSKTQTSGSLGLDLMDFMQ
ncbi:hypothetical protein K505DRAFT_233514 [Melanomma pulvis-pyrius CBS 109.77]|uniref:Rpr2-domain-containing protein n=1 Tax=Melanomma pulvis-pyrius CBS 109.77 TaxID=1314802 RepID=A0A6A6XPG0_9PLEO|nr:hypothetical protein K505DRAFT_233514 [Melanomma pulvis-pyrius CBS 109.77]